MDFSKLSGNEKLAVYGSAAVIIGGLVGYNYGGFAILAVLAAVGLLAVVFLPQFSPGTNLPGSRGSLMVVLGGIAGVVLLLALIISAGTVFRAFNVRDLFFLIAVAGGLLMAWAGWQELQGEGGTFKIGSASSATAPTPSSAPTATTSEPAAPAPTSEPAPPPPAAQPPAEPAAAPTAEPPASPPAEPAAATTEEAPTAEEEDRPSA